MKAKFIIVATALLSVSAINASAQNNRSLQDENQRIHQGVMSGQLTAGETARLHAQKAQLRREAIRYKTNDGKIGPRERADLKRDNRRLSKNICRQKHDRQKRF
ncbi:MAG: hypothetical protein H7Z13_08580 [Ferruginibacter sp.]|nr:hypothetical protein [Ferruginibacter sp.]